MVNYLEDREKLKSAFCGSKDVLMLDIKALGKSAVLVYVDGMTDKELIDRNVIEPLKNAENEKFLKNENALKTEQSERGKLKVQNELKEEKRNQVITADTINNVICISDPIIVVNNLEEMIISISDGDVGLLIEDAQEYYVLSLRKYVMRGITEPPVSTVLRGPREGFVEDMKTNMTMIRRRFRSPNLVFELMKTGKYTSTNIALCYLSGVAEQSVIDEIKKRINEIDCDGIIDSSYVARYIEDNKYSLFNQVGTAEKPDIIAGKVLEGRVAIIVDGSPTVITLPFVMYEHFQASEDYYIKSYRASATRILRVIAMIIAISLPGAYVALQEFQYQMFPLKFLIVIMNSIYGVPLTPMLEMIVLLILFEILNETSVRMPRYVGTALSIVGAIVLGEAAVNAGLLSVPSLLVTAVSTIGLYGVPDEVDACSILRMLFVAIAGVFGIFGLILSAMLLFAYLVSLKNYGTSYLAPFSPMLIADMQDTLTKENLIDMKKRPYSIPTTNRTRAK